MYTDENWNADYDSTWEDEVSPKKKPKQQSQRYEESMPNLEFYQNKMQFQPNGVTIEEFHQDWSKDYVNLEENHSFIQWLFPLQKRGVNWYATPLTLAEIEMMKKDEDVMRRFLESYKIMLGFYGIQLVNEETGEVNRAKNWMERFSNLNSHRHNNLRITRILKCLGVMGYDHFQAPLVRFFLEETLCNNQLPNVKRSAVDYFISTVKDKQERRKLEHFAWKKYKHWGPFIWGLVEKLKNFTGKTWLIKTKKPIVYQAESPENEEEHELLPGTGDKDRELTENGSYFYRIWYRVLSIMSFIVNCFCSRRR